MRPCSSLSRVAWCSTAWARMSASSDPKSRRSLTATGGIFSTSARAYGIVTRCSACGEPTLQVLPLAKVAAAAALVGQLQQDARRSARGSRRCARDKMRVSFSA